MSASFKSTKTYIIGPWDHGIAHEHTFESVLLHYKWVIFFNLHSHERLDNSVT